ncbi:annexin-B12-like isoform X1 [Argiope bruennichi]|uniref:annexin-B12-like isoform X1 n=1 Tax=Argiope bruennichi TaxID=94029 RepID=UPI00249517D7|nr:annexin-B12-like isoform X1 [Argiope bruennichi]
MVDYKTRGTISPATEFNVENVVSRLRKAMRGIGTDEKVIIDILTGHSNSQRQIIKKKYKTIYGRVLEEDIKSELGGHFEDVCLALLTPLAEYIVDSFYFAIKGLRTDEKCIIELLISLESMDLRYVKTVFKEKYNQDLDEFLISGLTGEIKSLVAMLITKEREFYVEVDEELAEADAQHMANASLSKTWKAEDFLISFLTTRNKPQLRAAVAVYEKITGHSFKQSIRNEFGGSVKHALLALVNCIENRPAFFASQLHDALNGPKTDDATLIRILVSRSEVDLADIYEWYHMKYDVDLCEAIYADTSGDYRTILLKILNPPK